jgi:hypothetical protein
MLTKLIDIRDQKWQELSPTYLVIFWTEFSEPDAAGWTSEEWELTQADVEDVLRWTADNRGQRLASIWLVLHDHRGRGHIRLSGTDPTAVQPD